MGRSCSMQTRSAVDLPSSVYSFALSVCSGSPKAFSELQDACMVRCTLNNSLYQLFPHGCGFHGGMQGRKGWFGHMTARKVSVLSRGICSYSSVYQKQRKKNASHQLSFSRFSFEFTMNPLIGMVPLKRVSVLNLFQKHFQTQW